MTAYVELQVLTHFSLLRGASSPEELYAAAALLGYPALGVCASQARTTPATVPRSQTPSAG